ncbi:MAG: hypothetical protein FJX72_11985 [Armatimonadetes bacterium]|nr:hypothetical protein [Armatimonadota bacterium]
MNEIQEYNGVEAALAGFKAKYADRVYDVTTKAGMADARLARREVREVRTGLEKLRKEIKQPALARCQAIDSEAKRITAALLEIEEPIDALIGAEEMRVQREKEAKAEAEARRVEAIRQRIEAFNVMPPWGAKADQISARLREVNEIVVDDTFQEFTEAAAIAKAQAITRLSTLANEARTLEAEQEQLRKAKAETDARMAEERRQNEARLAEEREARRKAEAEAEAARNEERARLAEEARIAREGQMLAEQVAEEERLVAREAAERAAHRAALAAAKCETYQQALDAIRSVVTLYESDQMEADAALNKIAVILEANK